MSNHLKTAREIGVQKALKEAGYASVADVEKQAAELGLIQAPKTASLDHLLAVINKK
jgi:hypothetical protein